MIQTLLSRAARAAMACLTAGTVLFVGTAPALATSPFLLMVDAPKEVAIDQLIPWDLKVPAGLKAGTNVIFRLEGEAEGELVTQTREGDAVHANGMMSVAPTTNRRIFRVMKTLRQEAVIRMTGRFRKAGAGRATVGAYALMKVDGRWTYVNDRKIEPFIHQMKVGGSSPFCAVPASNGGGQNSGDYRTTLTTRATYSGHMGEKMGDFITRSETRVYGPLTIIGMATQNVGASFNSTQYGGLLHPNDNVTWGGVGLGLQSMGADWYANGGITQVISYDFWSKESVVPVWGTQGNLDLSYSWNSGLQQISLESQGSIAGNGSFAIRGLTRLQVYRWGWFAPQVGAFGLYFRSPSDIGAEGAALAPGGGFRLGTNRLAWDVFAGGTPSGPSLTSGITARF